jgi:hypothetical protein
MQSGSLKASHEMRQSTEASSYKPSLMRKILSQSQLDERPEKPT